MSWGVELWDKYNVIVSHTQNGLDFLENSVASLIKDRSKVEAEYAKGLRALVKKYMPKETSSSPEEEYTHVKAYKQMLQEIGFQAGQHELLAENYSKDHYKTVHETAKKLRDSRKRHMKDAEKLEQELKHAKKSMMSTKEKFRKAYDEQEKAVDNYRKANNDNNVTKNELEKLQLSANRSSQQCDDAKGRYASQLLKTNEFQSKYYHELLPNILEALQRLEQERINIAREALLKVVEAEKQVNPIIIKCLDSIEDSLKSVDPVEDTEITIERYKSGDVPPGEFKFEDMKDPQAMLNQDALEKPTNFNLYPKKRELEKSIEEAEKELAKKHKELTSLKKLVETYKNNPKFGNSKQFTGEIDNLTRDISDIESALASMRAQLANVEDRLETLRTASPMMNNSHANSSSTLVRSNLHLSTPRSSSSQSSSGSLKSTLSSSMGVLHGQRPMNTSPDADPIYSEWGNDDVAEDTVDNDIDNVHFPRCIALYPYPCQGAELQECNIPMGEGEELEVIEGDSEGWTRVRRIGCTDHPMGVEGYVPTAFLRMLNV